MNINGMVNKHWVHVTSHFLFDALLFWLAFLFGVQLRFNFSEEWLNKFNDYWPGMTVGGLVFSCAAYIAGLYSGLSFKGGLFRRAFILTLCFAAAFAMMLVIFYLYFQARIGRGVMIFGTIFGYGFILAHHVWLSHRLKNFRERVIYVVTCPFDELETSLFKTFEGHQLDLVGVVHSTGYQPTMGEKVLGSVEDLARIVEREGIHRVLCTDRSLADPTLYKHFCQLRYSGITVMPLISLCEEIEQCVPLELVTPEWLLQASALPHMLYIKKIKRGFDIACSLAGLLFLGPFLLLGVLLVKLTSPGPVLFRQVRSGRFGRPFEMFKLRTMRIDAEKDGAQWSSKDDPRVTPVGKMLRKYRIDEIPQLINVLRGDMSFVGPRPERPEFIDELQKQVPYFRERLMIQPGITGWAQVSFPYGASVDDAKRKLEYDLYYMKNMSLFLDVFILLDTVRTILHGGATRPVVSNPGRQEVILELGRMRAREATE